MTDRVRRQKISGEVRRQLLDLIESGTVGPGEPLPSERELMERIGVGRPAIREAMQSLETIGLIEIRHGGRARVAEPSVGRMVDQVGQSMKHILFHSPASRTSRRPGQPWNARWRRSPPGAGPPAT